MFTLREKRAIAYVAEQRGWRMTLCSRPWVYFYTRRENDDCTVRLRLSEVLTEYDQHLKAEYRARRHAMLS